MVSKIIKKETTVFHCLSIGGIIVVRLLNSCLNTVLSEIESRLCDVEQKLQKLQLDTVFVKMKIRYSKPHLIVQWLIWLRIIYKTNWVPKRLVLREFSNCFAE